MARRPSTKPTKPQLLDGIEAAVLKLSDMGGRWRDGIAPKVREEILAEVRDPLLKLFLQSGRTLD